MRPEFDSLETLIRLWVCSSVGRAAVSKAAGRGFESLRTRLDTESKVARLY